MKCEDKPGESDYDIIDLDHHTEVTATESDNAFGAPRADLGNFQNLLRQLREEFKRAEAEILAHRRKDRLSLDLLSSQHPDKKGLACEESLRRSLTFQRPLGSGLEISPVSLAVPELPGSVYGETDHRESIGSFLACSELCLPTESPPRSTCHAVMSDVSTPFRQEYKLDPAWMSSVNPHSDVGVVQEHEGFEVEEEDSNETVDYDGLMKGFIRFPGSPWQMTWDLAGGVLILYDLLVVPLFVFSPPPNGFTTVMDWFTLVFWTANMGMTITVGCVDNGVTIMDPRMILSHYLRTWFILDFICVGPDWYFSLDFAINAEVDDGVNGGNSTKMMRMLRLSRCVRLLRLAKLKQILQTLQDLLDSVYLNIILNVVKMIIFLLAINHYVACIWFAVADVLGGEEPTWISYHGFQNDSRSYKYAVAFHWSITQFTPSSMHVQPQNMTERIFAIIIIVFALVGFSYIVGAISASLARIRGMQEDASNQFWILRKYLRQNKVPRTLGIRIQRYLEHAWSAQETFISTKSARIFGLLSEQLSSELECATLRPLLKVHPLLDHFFDLAPATMRRLCKVVVSRKSFAAGDDLFFPGEVASLMYFVSRGKLYYSKVSVKEKGRDSRNGLAVRAKDWIAEHSLWLESWIHVGILSAGLDCELIALVPKTFAEVISLSPGILKQTARYARYFLNELGKLDATELSDITQEQKAREFSKAFFQENKPLSRSATNSTLGKAKKTVTVKMRLPLRRYSY